LGNVPSQERESVEELCVADGLSESINPHNRTTKTPMADVLLSPVKDDSNQKIAIEAAKAQIGDAIINASKQKS
jgi:hypothetical protein